MKRPNILIVMTDHQRADTVLPEHPALTPNLDRLTGEGVTFTQTFCPTPHCCPARATFFSGLYPSRHGVWNNICNDQALSRGLNDGVRLWSEDLAAAGYRLHFSGKWHVSVEESPGDRGWTEDYVSAGKGTLHGLPWERFRDVVAHGDSAVRGEGEILRPGYGTYRLYGERDFSAEDHDEKAVQTGVDVLKELTSDAEDDRPWCLYVGMIGPHDPYKVPRRYLEQYAIEDVPLPPSYHDDLSDKPRVYKRMRDQVFGQLSEREVREGIRHFWAYCSYLDHQFGRLMEVLDASGAADDTLVVYCSDHGDYCGEHGLFAKGIPCFQGAYHVPAVVRWPAAVADPGRRVDAFVSLADFAPTVLEAVGIEPDRPFSGTSLVPFLRGEEPVVWRDDIQTQCNGVELYYTQRSVMTKDAKYVFNGFDDDELYDLRRDPHETRNVAGDPAFAGLKREMCRRMWRFAYRESDAAINPYITVGLAPYGPAEAFQPDDD